MDFELKYREGKLYAVVVIEGVTHEKEVTDYFIQDNPHDDWLDYRIGLKQMHCEQCQMSYPEHTTQNGSRLCGACYETHLVLDGLESME